MKRKEVGIVSTGVYIPDRWMTSFDIAEHSGLPIEVIEQKMGIKKKQFRIRMIIHVKWVFMQLKKR